MHLAGIAIISYASCLLWIAFHPHNKHEYVRCDYTQFLQVISFLQVTKGLPFSEMRFSPQVWFQRIPIIFSLYQVNLRKDSHTWVLFWKAPWSHCIFWNRNTQVKITSQKEAEMFCKVLRSLSTPVKLLCNFRKIVELVRSTYSLMGWEGERMGIRKRNKGEWWW